MSPSEVVVPGEECRGGARPGPAISPLPLRHGPRRPPGPASPARWRPPPDSATQTQPCALAHVCMVVVTAPCLGPRGSVSFLLFLVSPCGGGCPGWLEPFPKDDRRDRWMFRGNEWVPRRSLTRAQTCYCSRLLRTLCMSFWGWAVG